MRPIHWLAVIVLGFEMPVPIYWIILHSKVAFWRRHVRVSFWIALISAWGAGDWLLYHFRHLLFASTATESFLPIRWNRVAGVALIAVDLFTFFSVEFELGGSRLVGHAEVTGRADLATSGLYTRVRHPRYLGMIAGVIGGCLVTGTTQLWLVVFFWCCLALLSIALEERELRVRFGGAYRDYAQRVPALLPFRLQSRR